MGKKKQAGTVRTNISLPRSVKEAMEGVEGVNWSAVAVRAFQDKLAEIAAKKEKKSMTDVIQRLRVSRRRSDEARWQEGELRGRDWAMHDADAESLARLEELHDRTEGHDWHWWFRPEVSSHAPYERLMHVIDPGTKEDRQAARERWQQIVGEDEFRTIDPDFVQAFAESALAVWKEVKDQL
jgi:ABC-type Zn2+ transport system substrate-binding protein/surface adhesin